MVSPINFTNSPENFKPETQFDNGTAIGMPPIHYDHRKTPPISNINNPNTYNPDHNPIRRYNQNLAPSNGSLTEAFLKARITFNPVFMHNEAATRYQMISKMFYSGNDIKNNLLKVA